VSQSAATIQQRLADYRDQVETALRRRLPLVDRQPERLHAAMHYTVLGPGKRIRPALCYAAAEALHIPCDRLDSAACALELIHAYSLVHDDLPAMDDDDWRRGRPTCHRAYDEATAILTGDALQTLAFQVLAQDETLSAEQRVHMIATLACASGSEGMAGGQMLDLQAVQTTLALSDLEAIHQRKTGALIEAAVALPAHLLGKPDPAVVLALHGFGRAIGLAFQILDDILDAAEASSGHDRIDKASYAHLLGLEQARIYAQQLHEQALHNLELFGDAAQTLRGLAEYLLVRQQ
jgi:farnesyl diphosphate synthase